MFDTLKEMIKKLTAKPELVPIPVRGRVGLPGGEPTGDLRSRAVPKVTMTMRVVRADGSPDEIHEVDATAMLQK